MSDRYNNNYGRDYNSGGNGNYGRDNYNNRDNRDYGRGRNNSSNYGRDNYSRDNRDNYNNRDNNYNRDNYNNRDNFNRDNKKVCRDWVDGSCENNSCPFFHPETHPYYAYVSKTMDIHPDELRLGVTTNQALEQEADGVQIDNYVQLVNDYMKSMKYRTPSNECVMPSFKAFSCPFDTRRVYGEIEKFQNEIKSNSGKTGYGNSYDKGGYGGNRPNFSYNTSNSNKYKGNYKYDGRARYNNNDYNRNSYNDRNYNSNYNDRNSNGYNNNNDRNNSNNNYNNYRNNYNNNLNPPNNNFSNNSSTFDKSTTFDKNSGSAQGEESPEYKEFQVPYK